MSEQTWLDKVTHFFKREPENRQDLVDLLHDVKELGIIDADALAMIEGVLQVSEMKVSHIMVPRLKMVAIDENETPKDFIPKILESRHSRYPVFEGNHENIKGILLAKDLLQLLADSGEEEFEWDEYLRPALIVPESKRLDILLQEFRHNQQHMAIVVDEYGAISGLVTIEDILEQIVGDIEDEYDVDEEQHYVKEQRDGIAVVKAIMPLKLFNEHFGTDWSSEYTTTIGGFLLDRWHRIPKRGEVLRYETFNFTVLSADHRRLYLLSVKREATQP